MHSGSANTVPLVAVDFLVKLESAAGAINAQAFVDAVPEDRVKHGDYSGCRSFCGPQQRYRRGGGVGRIAGFPGIFTGHGGITGHGSMLELSSCPGDRNGGNSSGAVDSGGAAVTSPLGCVPTPAGVSLGPISSRSPSLQPQQHLQLTDMLLTKLGAQDVSVRSLRSNGALSRNPLGSAASSPSKAAIVAATRTGSGCRWKVTAGDLRGGGGRDSTEGGCGGRAAGEQDRRGAGRPRRGGGRGCEVPREAQTVEFEEVRSAGSVDRAGRFGRGDAYAEAMSGPNNNGGKRCVKKWMIRMKMAPDGWKCVARPPSAEDSLRL